MRKKSGILFRKLHWPQVKSGNPERGSENFSPETTTSYPSAALPPTGSTSPESGLIVIPRIGTACPRLWSVIIPPTSIGTLRRLSLAGSQIRTGNIAFGYYYDISITLIHEYIGWHNGQYFYKYTAWNSRVSKWRNFPHLRKLHEITSINHMGHFVTHFIISVPPDHSTDNNGAIRLSRMRKCPVYGYWYLRLVTGWMWVPETGSNSLVSGWMVTASSGANSPLWGSGIGDW